MQQNFQTLELPGLRTVTGSLIKVYGRRVVHYQLTEQIKGSIDFIFCDSMIPIISVSTLFDKGYTTILNAGDSYFGREGTKVPIFKENAHFFLYPLRRLHPNSSDMHANGDDTRFVIAPVTSLDKVDHWLLDGDILTRVHRKLRQGLFSPFGV